MCTRWPCVFTSNNSKPDWTQYARVKPMAARLSRRTLSRNPAISKREPRLRMVATKTAETTRVRDEKPIYRYLATGATACAHEICSPFRFMARIALRSRDRRTESGIKKRSKIRIKMKKRKNESRRRREIIGATILVDFIPQTYFSERSH